jgi:predicted ATP-grasp superfamily ATP-dependent carboligase
MFITDALLRKSVAVCQSLGRQGIDVTAGSTTHLSPAFFSRYCRDRVIYPSPDSRPDDFVDMMLDYLHRNTHNVVFPTDDATLSLFSRYHEQFERVTHVPTPTPDRLSYALDKARTMILADRLGIPHPRTVFPRSADEAHRLAAHLGQPLLVKPRSSSGGRGIAYLQHGEAVEQKWNQVHQQFAFPMLQQQIPNGPKYDVCLIMDRSGRMVASFVQKELRHFPLRDGLSTLQESVWRPDLVERAEALLQAIGWYGLAEVEFMEDPETGEAMLLEINPRFWASIQLAIACGIDFPYLLYQVATGQHVKELHTYAVGRRCRWLLPGEVLHFLANPNRLHMDPPFFQFGRAETVSDGLYADDLGATLGVLLSCGHYLFDHDLWGMVLRGKRRGQPEHGRATQTAPAVLQDLSA